MELLPALALGVGFAARGALGALRRRLPQWEPNLAGALLVLVAANAAWMVRERPLVYVEGTKNLAARRGYDLAVPRALRDVLEKRPGATVLMNTSVFPEMVAATGIPLKQTINESDLEIWDRALTAPGASAQVVVAFDGDDVDRAVKAHPEGLELVYKFHSTTEPAGAVYLSSSYAGQW
jgi:hypothetical protein